MRRAVEIVAGVLCLFIAGVFGLGALSSAVMFIGLLELFTFKLSRPFALAFLIVCVLGVRAFASAGLDFLHHFPLMVFDKRVR